MSPEHWIATAASSLEAAGVLHAAGHYPHAVFVLQQSTEAAFKGFESAMRPGISKAELTKDIGHEPMTYLAARLRRLADRQTVLVDLVTRAQVNSLSTALDSHSNPTKLTLAMLDAVLLGARQTL